MMHRTQYLCRLTQSLFPPDPSCLGSPYLEPISFSPFSMIARPRPEKYIGINKGIGTGLYSVKYKIITAWPETKPEATPQAWEPPAGLEYSITSFPSVWPRNLLQDR